MSSGGVTYLEAFIESIGALPHEFRRNLDLMRDLDESSSKELAELLQLQREYLHAAEEKLTQLQMVELEDGTFGVRVVGGGNDNDSSAPVIVPTTAELMSFTYNADKYSQIQRLQQESLEKAEEKVQIAQQAYQMIDSTIHRLDKDLEAMEKILQTSGVGDFSSNSSGTQPKPNDLAACQISPGSEWILAKVLHHDPTTGVYKLADEDVESNKIFHLPESQVVLCGVEKLSRGDSIYAVYPDTTSFYQANVALAPRKQGTTAGAFVMVNFVDDSDEFGVTHDKAVSIQHVINPPYGAN
jgi:hypothetical protein